MFRIDHFLGKEAAQNILGLPFRQRPVRADLEPQPHRPRADRRPRDARVWATASAFYEQTGAYRDMVVTHLFQILGFMAMEPPTALEPEPISEEKNKVFRCMLPIDAGRCGARPVRGVPDGGGGRRRLGYRDLHRAEVLHRQLALGRRALLPAHRQAPGRRAAHHLDRVPRAAQEHVSGRLRRRRAGPRPPDLRPGRCRRRCRCRSTASGPARACSLDKLSLQFAMHETGHDRRRARGLRAADPRRDARRPHAVHHRRGHRAPVGGVDAAARGPPPVRFYEPGCWGPNAIHQLIAPHAWRLPFERAWRQPDPVGG